MQKEVLNQSMTELSQGMTLVYKWGCDGSAGQSTYKDGYSETGNPSKSDANLSVGCIVPLQLHRKNWYILWQNPRPSSTRYCRPIKLIFYKETMEVTKKRTAKHLQPNK